MTNRACIIAVGNEVVHGFIVNTNSAWLARELGELGFDVAYHLSVNDRESELVRRIKAALDEGLFVVTTGGIGPTMDDRTRQGAATALGVELKLDHDALAKLQERYAAMGRKFPEGSERQCMRPEGSKHIQNSFGTASCFLARDGTGGLAALPVAGGVEGRGAHRVGQERVVVEEAQPGLLVARHRELGGVHAG